MMRVKKHIKFWSFVLRESFSRLIYGVWAYLRQGLKRAYLFAELRTCLRMMSEISIIQYHEVMVILVWARFSDHRITVTVWNASILLI